MEMINIPKVQVQVHKKLKLLVDEASGFPEVSDLLVEAYRRLRFVDLSVLLNEKLQLIRMFREIVFPLERDSYPPSNWSPNVSLDENWADEALKNTLIIGVDTSEIKPTPHVSPLFLLVNIGYQAIFFGDELTHSHGSMPYFYASKEILTDIGRYRYVPSWLLEVKRLEDECRVVQELLKSLPQRDFSYVFFDESFSVNYLTARSKEFRSKVVEALVKMHENLRRLNAVPIGIFYTRSRAFTFTIIKSILCASKNCLDCIKRSSDLRCRELSTMRDSVLFDKALDTGWRSPLFDVKNKVIEDFSDLKVLGFYVKIGSGNMLRVEFPDWCRDHVDGIHKVVLAQSIVGRGYPYILERAHEEAYISPRERAWLLSYIDRLLRASSDHGLTLSGKLKRKIRGVV